MKERTITAFGLIAAVALALYLGESAILILVAAFLILASYEVYHTRKGKIAPIMVPVYALLVMGSIFIPIEWGVAYISVVLMFLFIISISFVWFNVKELSYAFLMIALLIVTILGLRNILSIGVLVLLYVMVATYVTDSFAFFGGKKFGKNKLIPRISPKKTVEGAISGYAAGVIVSFIFAYVLLLDQLDLSVIIVASLLIPFISQLGDLAFSLVKRNYGIKDFGFIFPGHGGALDRIDSLIFAVLAFNIVLTLFL